jgi:hypothetical protein
MPRNRGIAAKGLRAEEQEPPEVLVEPGKGGAGNSSTSGCDALGCCRAPRAVDQGPSESDGLPLFVTSKLSHMPAGSWPGTRQVIR